jgi:molybdopterin-guanine dinucleotide biosynthesis protein A
MGRPKAWLPFGGETLLERVVRRLRPAVGRLAVVGSRELVLPALPSDVMQLVDQVEDEGPLEGIAVGLEALREHAAYVYVTACDAPFVVPAFARRLFELTGDDGAVPVTDGRAHPLTAVYATQAAGRVRALRTSGERRARSLVDTLRVRKVDAVELLAADALRAADPELRSLTNLNEPNDYEAALALDAHGSRALGETR